MKLSIGLLPFYLKLYDDVAPSMHEAIESFYLHIADLLRKKGITVETTQICRLEQEFQSAVDAFSKENVQAIVTLHLAYSPSLESIKPLLSTEIPLIILNTTPDFPFGPTQLPERISFNHGIHGVQDMCSMLVRNNRQFYIESGHWEESDVIDRVIDRIRGIAAAESFKGSKIRILGEPFAGMGDFQIEPTALKEEYGIETITFGKDQGSTPMEAIRSVDDEISYYETFADISDVPDDIMRANAEVTQLLRVWAEKESLDGFTCNFLSVTTKSPIKRVPFLFAAVGMYEGIGYAGEGDILTAALVGSLLKLNAKSTFTEIFCPDWESNQLFLSHMGEINPRICPKTAKMQAKEYNFSDALPPVFSTGQCMKGDAFLVNLIPLSTKSFRLLICPVKVIGSDKTEFSSSVHGWIQSTLPISDFLSEYSKLGGTHHSGLIYDERIETLKTFGEQLGWDVKVIG